MRAASRRLITPLSWSIANGPDANLVPRVRSSTARPSRRPKLAATWLRRGQKDQWTQAPCTRRHGWARPHARTASSECSRSRWRRTAPVRLSSHLPVHPAGLRRRRIRKCKSRQGHIDLGRDRAQNPNQVGFAIQSRRWVVERFFAWIGRNRRLAKDFEATVDSARAFLYAASVMLLVRRIARAS
jgi:transposase